MSQWLEEVLQQQNLQSNGLAELVPVLTLESGGIYYLVDFTYLSEVIELQHIVPYPVPGTLHLGIINMRGNIVPILCLSCLLNKEIPAGSPNPKGRIVVFNGPHGHFGVIAESVRKVAVDPNALETNEELHLGEQVFKVLKSDFFDAVREEAV